MLQLVDLLLCLPASSADCERGFSLAKVIKSDWRSRLRDMAVTNLMAIQSHSPDTMDFDPMPAIHRWKGKCKCGDLFAATLMLPTQTQIMTVK